MGRSSTISQLDGRTRGRLAGTVSGVHAPDAPAPDVPVADVPVADVIARGLDILFCGVNPGLRSAAVGHHFAHRGNRFWKLLHLAGLTDRVLAPVDERLLLTYGIGVTNLVDRATRSADEVSAAELRRGAGRLVEKARRWQPRNVAVLGLGAYRSAFERPNAQLGLQPLRFGSSRVWVLANPSGRQAYYRLEHMVEQMQQLKETSTGVDVRGRQAG